MKKRGVIKIDWIQARIDFCSQNPIEYVHWSNYLFTYSCLNDCHHSKDKACHKNCFIKKSMNFLRSHGIGVKELAFTQYDITPGHDCKVNRSFYNVVQ